MTDDDFRRIEEELGITLPEPYRRLLCPFPVADLRRNNDTDLWDDADSVIAENLKLRTEFVKGHQPWSNRWFFIGDPLTACANAIDLGNPAAPVSWLDHCDLSTATDESGEPFEEWVVRWGRVVRGKR